MKTWNLVVMLKAGNTFTTYAGATTERKARRMVERDTGGVVLSCLCLGEE